MYHIPNNHVLRIRSTDLTPNEGCMHLWPVWALYEAKYLVEPLGDLAFLILRFDYGCYPLILFRNKKDGSAKEEFPIIQEILEKRHAFECCTDLWASILL
jgi:hypothetical protein